MKSLILLFLLSTVSLSGTVAVTESDPSTLVEGIVNIITGDLYALEDDIIVQGAEPLRLRRSYISGKGGTGWHFFENLTATLRPPSRILTVNEPSGTSLIYHYDLKVIGKQEKHKKKKEEPAKEQKLFHPLNVNQDAQGLTNTARGKISAHTNLKNQYVVMDDDSDRFTIICPNGSKRIYKAIPDQKPDKLKTGFGKLEFYLLYHYRLHSEELPNGNLIIYDWHKNTLQSIRTTDPSGQKTYAQATFHFHGKTREKDDRVYLDNADFDIHTSDGRILQYRYFCDGKPEKQGVWYLHQIHSSDTPPETIHYYGQEAYRNRVLAAITLPQSRNLHIGYYNNPQDPKCNRVQLLSAPVGTDHTPHVTHQIDYNLTNRMANVVDVKNVPAHYYWNEALRLTRINRFTSSHELCCSTIFQWGSEADDGNLVCKALTNEQQRLVYATTYAYDSQGNVRVEKFYGKLTGEGTKSNTPLGILKPTSPLQYEGLPTGLTFELTHRISLDGFEAYSKRFDYSQDGKNLLIRKEEDNGLCLTYDYLPGTDLPFAEFAYEKGQIKRRKFYEYNADRILIQEITDDGITADRNNLSNVKTRLIRQIHPKPDPPFLNMPQIIEEKYWDGQAEKLLKKTVVHYTIGGRIERKDIYDATGAFRYSLTYKHDEKGDLRQETNAIGQTAISDYDELGNKIFFQDFGSRTHLKMSYDCSNRLFESREVGDDGSVRLTRHDYDGKHNKILTIDPYGYETRYVYNSFNQIIETHQPAMGELQPVITSSYDAAGREITHTDAKGYKTLTTYNAYGKPLSVLHADETRERFIYYLDGTLRTHIDQNGVETTYTYDLFGRATSIAKSFNSKLLSQELFIYDAFHLITKTDAEGHVTTYEYDGAGRKVAEQLNQERLEYFYDDLGRLHAVKNGNLLSITEYDLLDRIEEERKEDLEGHVLSKIVYTYDAAGNQNSITRFIDGKEAAEILEYDCFNRLNLKKDPLGNITLTVYDDKQHSKAIIDPLGLQTIETFNSHYLTATLEKRSSKNELLLSEENKYDANGNLISKETTLYNPRRSVLTFWDYGPLDRLETLTEAAGSSEQKITQYTYTFTGKLRETIKPSGIVLTNRYDRLDHLSSLESSDGTIHYIYNHDRLGRLLKSIDQVPKTTLVRTYDPRGRLLTETLPNNLFFQNHYDVQGRRTRLDLPGNSFIIYDYGPLYLHKVTRYFSGNSIYTHTYSRYDLAGNLLSEEPIGNLGAVSHGYDVASRPTSLISPYFSHEILEHDPVGNILQERLHGEMLEYTYDDLYQLTSEKEHTYSYDALYNRLQKDTVSYSVNALNQLPSEFKYNADGNPRIHKDARFDYDALDRLVSYENKTHKLHFTYDSYHRRLTKTVFLSDNGQWKPLQTSFFLYDGKNEIGSIDASGNLTELRILGRTPQAEIGSSIAIELHGKVFAPIHDLHGNVARLVSLSDQSREKYRYSAFGEERDPPSTLNPWRFSSKRIDEETALVYFGRRYYSPAYGRWLTPDPLGLEAGPNLYSYVFNAPLTHVDLYGLFAFYNREINLQDCKQSSFGAIHGAGHYAMNTASAISTIGWGLTMPFRALNWMAGKSSFSQDWSSLQRSNAAFHDSGQRWMQRAFPGDPNHEGFQALRSGVSKGLEYATMAWGVVRLPMTAYSYIEKGISATKDFFGMQKIARQAMQVTDIPITKMGNLAKTTTRNRLAPNLYAAGDHTVFRRDPMTGRVTHYETFRLQTNLRDPKPWESIKRFDNSNLGQSHFNKILKQEIFEPHVHDPLYPGKVRSALPWENPK